MIEAMTEGGTKERGKLLTSESGIKRVGEYGPAISEYHKSLPKKIINLTKNQESQLENGMKIISRKVRHSDPSTVGIIFKTNKGKIGFTSDTEYHDELNKIFSDLRILIMNITRPKGARIPHHLSTEDAIKLIEKTKPKLSVMTHFGMKMLKKDIGKQAKIIRNKTNQRCIAANDAMEIKIEESIKVSDQQKKITNY